MRSALLLALVACGDKRQADPVTPSGSSVATPSLDAATALPSRIALRAGTKPPRKTAQPLARDQLTKLAALELAGLMPRVRKLDDDFLDVEYTLKDLPIAVGVVVQPCMRCEPMQLDRWRAETDALRITLPPDLRERSDATFEVTQVSLAGTPAIATYQLVHVAGDKPQFDEAVTVYFNDGVNQLRVIARFAGPPPSKIDDDGIERRELEQLATAVLDRFAQSW